MNILYILFQISCIILLMLASKNYQFFVDSEYETTVFVNNYTTKNMINYIKQIKPIKKNPLSLKVMEELKKTILNRKESKFEELENLIKLNNWNNKYNFDNIINNKRGIILDLNSVNFNDRITFNKFKENIKFIEIKCFENSIILFIIGEKKENSFISDLNYFNKLNYISPYNYTKSYFWSKPLKLAIGNVVNKPCNVSINDMISDISNQYGILLNDLSIINFNNNYNKVNYNIQHNVIM